MDPTLRDTLQAELDLLVDRQSRIQAHLRNRSHALPQDWDDRSTATQGDVVLEQLDESALERIEALREALQRIDEGDYGTCTVCGAEIASARLHALPTADTCIACAR
jgi:DnaK suppressor protein